MWKAIKLWSNYKTSHLLDASASNLVGLCSQMTGVAIDHMFYWARGSDDITRRWPNLLSFKSGPPLLVQLTNFSPVFSRTLVKSNSLWSLTAHGSWVVNKYKLVAKHIYAYKRPLLVTVDLYIKCSILVQHGVRWNDGRLTLDFYSSHIGDIHLSQ